MYKEIIYFIYLIINWDTDRWIVHFSYSIFRQDRSFSNLENEISIVKTLIMMTIMIVIVSVILIMIMIKKKKKITNDGSSQLCTQLKQSRKKKPSKNFSLDRYDLRHTGAVVYQLSHQAVQACFFRHTFAQFLKLSI